MHKRLTHHLMAALMGVVFTADLVAQPTAFTYQGQLTENGVPATGLFDLRFELSSSPSNSLVLGVITNMGTEVIDGLFAVMLDFGPGVFDGNERWLEIGARTNGGGAFSTLAPRQQITSTPYAIKATEAAGVSLGAITGDMLADGSVTAAKLAEGAVSQLGSPDGSPLSALTVDEDGHVAVGTDDARAGLHITAGHPILGLEPLSVVVEGSGGFSNLSGVAQLALDGDLLVAAAQGDGLTLISLANKSNPFLLSQIKDGQGGFNHLSGVYDVALSSDLLAVAAIFDSAVSLIHVTNPASPALAATLQDGVGGFNELGTATGVAFGGNLLAIASLGDDAVTLVDVSNPASPVLRAMMKDGSFGFDELGGAYHVALSGSLLAVAAFYDDAVTLVDVSNPSFPVFQSAIKDGFNGFDELDAPTRLAIEGNLLAIASREDDAVTLVDIGNPTNPVVRAVLKKGQGGVHTLDSPEGLALSGGRLFITGRADSTVTLVDVSNPADPRLLGSARNGQAGLEQLASPFGVVLHGDNPVVAAESSSAVSVLQTVTNGLVSLATEDWVGIGTTIPEVPLHVFGDVIVDGEGELILRSGRLSVGQGAAASGNNSVALGTGTEADGESSIATGYASKATTNYATAIGYESEASGEYSTAIGQNTSASAYASLAAGSGTLASGQGATALGVSTVASGLLSTALGVGTTASGDYSMAMGYVTTASGTASTAMGSRARANHEGTFVWADATDADFTSTSSNQFLIRASGGVGIGKTNPASALDVNGTVTATGLAGSGAGLTALNASQLTSGTVPSARISGTYSAPVTFSSAANSFSGTGSSLTALNASQLTSGTVADARLSSNVAHRSGGNAFTGDQTVTSGSVGIGTSSPANPLSVAGNADMTGQVSIGITGADARLLVRGVTGEDAFRVRVETSTKLLVKDNGGLGVGANFADVPANGLRTAGSVGVGRLPTANALEVQGDASKTTAGSWLANSDRRIKEDIQPVDKALETLGRVNLVSFRYADDYRQEHPGVEDRRYLNVVAQEFREVFPEHVRSSGEKLPNGSEILQVDTYPLTIYSAAAIQELDRKLEAIRTENARLRQELHEITQLLSTLSR